MLATKKGRHHMDITQADIDHVTNLITRLREYVFEHQHDDDVKVDWAQDAANDANNLLHDLIKVLHS